MDPLTLTTAFVELAAALTAIVLTLRRGPSQAATRRALVLYALGVALWGVLSLLESSGMLPLPLPGGYMALILVMVLYLHLTRVTVLEKGLVWWGWLIGMGLAAVPAALPPVLVQHVCGGMALFLAGAALGSALSARKGAQQPLHRNRAELWFLSALLMALSAGLFIVQFVAAAHLVQAAVLLLTLYAAIQYRLPDLRRILRHGMRHLLVTILSALLFLALFLLLHILGDAYPDLRAHPWETYSLIALGIAVVLKPALDGLTRWSERVLPTTGYDLTHTVREYSLSISNILELDTLATVAIGLINEALEVQSGMLFLAESKPGKDGRPIYELRGVRGMGQTAPLPLELPADDPLVRRLKENSTPLTQYEIDFSPEFRELGKEARQWLARHGQEVYVPIYTKEEWIGLLALGPKLSGAPYQEEDLNLLRTLADQTAVALSNARLVEGLTRLNNDFRRAYNAMQKANLQLEQANRQLERLDRTKSDFISVTSHELRTPLTLISGYAQLLLEDAQQQENDFHQQLLKGMLDGTDRMHAIISSMLDMASIDARSIKLRIEPLMLAPLIGMVVKSFRKTLEERNLTLETKNLQGVPTVEADPEALEKIFTHLVNNAIKYTPDGGKIIVAARLLSAEKNPLQTESVEIVVQDTGIGIDPKHLDLIFTKFYQTGEVSLHSSGRTKFKGGGPGLGLAIVRGLVQTLNGKVWAYSEGYDEEKCPGSRFHVVLPRRQPQQG